MIESLVSGYIQAVTRFAPLPALALLFALAPCLGCHEDDALVCGESPEITGTATFEGESHVFDHGSATLYMGGTPENPCIQWADVTAQGETAGLVVFLRPPEGGGPLQITSLGFGLTYPMQYGSWSEDEPKLVGNFDIEEHNDECARASTDVTATDIRMYLEASEDWGPYMLTNVELSVGGTWAIEWLDEACE